MHSWIACRYPLERSSMSLQALLAERLANISPGALQYTFFSNSGTEAVEAALKFARIATGKTDFISTDGSYHGKTMGSLAVTGREKYRFPFHPMVPGTVFVPFNNLEAAEAAITPATAGIVCRTDSGRRRHYSRTNGIPGGPASNSVTHMDCCLL